jgi:bifunctional DNA-binding transcriptional regulator/antitoxin component of YhaV-PrlF toxin-antitoxin module
MKSTQVVIEDWDGDGAIRIPDEVLQELGVDVGDTLYLIEEYVGTVRCFVLSKSPQIPDRVDELVSIWEASAPPPPQQNKLVLQSPAATLCVQPKSFLSRALYR